MLSGARDSAARLVETAIIDAAADPPQGWLKGRIADVQSRHGVSALEAARFLSAAGGALATCGAGGSRPN